MNVELETCIALPGKLVVTTPVNAPDEILTLNGITIVDPLVKITFRLKLTIELLGSGTLYTIVTEISIEPSVTNVVILAFNIGGSGVLLGVIVGVIVAVGVFVGVEV